MTEYTQQRRSYAEYYRPRRPWRRLAWWWQRHHLQKNPPPPKSDGLDYTGWTVRIFEKDPDDVFPRAEHVGSVGFVAESDVQCDGERSHRIEFETMSCQGIYLPAAHIELIPPDDPLVSHVLTLNVDELVARYGPLRANVHPSTEGHLRYLIVTREDEQGTTLATLSDLTHVNVPDPDGALWDAAGWARRNFNRHAARTDELLIPAGPTVDELVNGYRRPGAPPGPLTD
ncbi:MAG: hypothetical protein ACRDTF_05825 [Pseudonocardiaceae bacterium]